MVTNEPACTVCTYRVLKNHGLRGEELWQVCRSTTVGYLTYAAPAWWGYSDVSSRQRLQAAINKLKKFNFLPPEFASHEQLCEQMCGVLFKQILANRNHVLHQLLPPERAIHYSMRPRAHNRQIIKADAKFKRNFIINMLYKNSY